MTKQIVCQDCGGHGFIRTVHNENSISARGCSTCGSTGLIDVSLTNADRIRVMSDEELARWISDVCHGFVSKPWCDFRCQNCREGDDYRCEKCVLEWLKQPAVE